MCLNIKIISEIVIKLKSPNTTMTLLSVQTKRRGRGFLVDGVALVGVLSALLLLWFLRFVAGVSCSTAGFASSTGAATTGGDGGVATDDAIRVFFNSAHASSHGRRKFFTPFVSWQGASWVMRLQAHRACTASVQSVTDEHGPE